MNYEPVSIIILNYNGKQFLADCLNSVLQQEYPGRFEIILVDNGSNDDSEMFVKKEFPDKVILLQTTKNLGFAGGNHFGYERASHDLIVFLNNDTIVRQNWLIELIKPLMENPQIGICSSKVFTPSEPDRDDIFNPSINLIGHNIRNVFKDGYTAFNPHGGSMAFRKSVIGFPFDTDYFLYSEDIYAGYLCHYKGYSVVWNHASKVYHHGSVSTKKVEPEYLSFLKERNRLLNFLLFWPVDLLWKILPFFVFNIILKTGIALFTKKYNLKGIFRSYLWILKNRELIQDKRDGLQLNFSKFQEFSHKISGKLFNDSNLLTAVVNKICIGYCRMMRIRVAESL